MLLYLTKLHIMMCDNIESIPDNGFGFLPLFCLTYLVIECCNNLKSFPYVHFPSLASLEEVVIKDCPSIDYSFPCGLWPPNLRKLTIGCLNKPMSEWGIQNFSSSLVELDLFGMNSGVVSFAEAEDVRNTTSSSFLPPPSLTSLQIQGFEDLKSVSKCLQHLLSLEQLWILSCPKLRDLPQKLLPSLSYLGLGACQKLGKRCRSGTGKYWPFISQIPRLWFVDGRAAQPRISSSTIHQENEKPTETVGEGETATGEGKTTAGEEGKNCRTPLLHTAAVVDREETGATGKVRY
ncbi:hypothetical protein OSB04_023806 [Centaurea solstitialis]|uniref:Disease resistance protein n=1 Tax=Centaurea solstitialis TaxID=347529 RepID=A0AA38WBG6_9ASTR|nr:hypothetical protein OSB04_023806 [Centaurea solstitialis]